MGYGLGGAAIGLFVGVSVFWCAMLLFRGIGGLCEASVVAGGDDYRMPMIPEPAARVLVKMKTSIEAGGTGTALTSLDVVPSSYYRILEKFGKLLTNPEAAVRFVSYPGVYDLFTKMGVIDVEGDPTVGAIVRERNAELLRNPELRQSAAKKDGSLIAALQKLDIEKALDYALTPPKPTPVP
jgi:hypothetical protein